MGKLVELLCQSSSTRTLVRLADWFHSPTEYFWIFQPAKYYGTDPKSCPRNKICQEDDQIRQLFFDYIFPRREEQQLDTHIVLLELSRTSQLLLGKLVRHFVLVCLWNMMNGLLYKKTRFQVRIENQSWESGWFQKGLSSPIWRISGISMLYNNINIITLGWGIFHNYGSNETTNCINSMVLEESMRIHSLAQEGRLQ